MKWFPGAPPDRAAGLCRFGGGSQSGSTTTVQKSDPWSGQQPYLTFGFNEAQNLFDSATPQYFLARPMPARRRSRNRRSISRLSAGSPARR